MLKFTVKMPDKIGAKLSLLSSGIRDFQINKYSIAFEAGEAEEAGGGRT